MSTLQPTFAPQRVALLGAGRVATQLGPALVQAGHQVVSVWSRTTASAQRLAAQLPSAIISPSLDFSSQPLADIYLLSVPDAAVPEVLAAANFPAGSLVVHTAGALPLALFEAYPNVRGGVFYPLQTFSPGRLIEWAAVPLCVEAADEAGQAVLMALAHSLSDLVRPVATLQRQRLHVAAVFAGNFTNHLLGISHTLLAEVNLPFELLAPLLRETVEKALAAPPFSVQTGPAARRDAPTLARHQAELTAHPTWLTLYKALSDSIQQQLPPAAPNNEAGL
ncbi:NADP oxidoreductase coenzyme F420-dependent [Hymenobacter roseosalivarius DSM 11622]|uniref:NADP oxidoreductase coenzyme F420-dependent n=1 Tax=Hymenobacter roseosalivarius DSM 11622 TaxID=645990 RepID=A0A1W1V232_9BACT|nr:Rossmann-like and DUF2520 domain-containing protein [Hymenobacter roseosalivarius]SMB87437.1 NADP oxidoreductase coenzyme F420-dependent [Hymenobacter roseosalivarius DSM 11622]